MLRPLGLGREVEGCLGVALLQVLALILLAEVCVGAKTVAEGPALAIGGVDGLEVVVVEERTGVANEFEEARVGHYGLEEGEGSGRREGDVELGRPTLSTVHDRCRHSSSTAELLDAFTNRGVDVSDTLHLQLGEDLLRNGLVYTLRVESVEVEAELRGVGGDERQVLLEVADVEDLTRVGEVCIPLVLGAGGELGHEVGKTDGGAEDQARCKLLFQRHHLFNTLTIFRVARDCHRARALGVARNGVVVEYLIVVVVVAVGAAEEVDGAVLLSLLVGKKADMDLARVVDIAAATIELVVAVGRDDGILHAIHDGRRATLARRASDRLLLGVDAEVGLIVVVVGKGDVRGKRGAIRALHLLTAFPAGAKAMHPLLKGRDEALELAVRTAVEDGLNLRVAEERRHIEGPRDSKCRRLKLLPDYLMLKD